MSDMQIMVKDWQIIMEYRNYILQNANGFSSYDYEFYYNTVSTHPVFLFVPLDVYFFVLSLVVKITGSVRSMIHEHGTIAGKEKFLCIGGSFGKARKI